MAGVEVAPPADGGGRPARNEEAVKVAGAGSVEFLVKYVQSSIRKDRKGYCIGFLAVFLVTACSSYSVWGR